MRACSSVGGKPIFINEAHGATLTDVDGNIFYDFVNSWGPIINGHSCPEIIESVSQALMHGTSFGAPTSLEIELAELICKLVPSIAMLRMVSSGTEATMSAIRLARAYTKRDILVKFNGCYHGHADSLLVEAGSGVATLGIPGSPGVPADVAKLTISVEYNDVESLNDVLSRVGAEKVAAIIVEPVAGNMGLVLPEDGFLQALRRVCDNHGIVLIFDEVMSGFRVALGGAQARYAVTPDLTTLGKVIGGGLPVGAFGGRKDIMKMLAPSGSVYQAGTLSGNPLAMAAGISQLKLLEKRNPYPQFEELSNYWVGQMRKLAVRVSVPICAVACGSLLGLFFTNLSHVRNYRDAKTTNANLFKHFYLSMLDQGFYLAPSAFESNFLSTAHTKEMLDSFISAAENALTSLPK